MKGYELFILTRTFNEGDNFEHFIILTFITPEIIIYSDFKLYNHKNYKKKKKITTNKCKFIKTLFII